MAKKPTTIQELVSSWTRASGDHLGLHGKLDLLELLNNELYSQYQPFAVKPNYMDRLSSWINGVSSTKDKKILLELALWLLFIGEEEMKSLYQASFSGIVTRWIIDQEAIDITAKDAGDRINEAMKRTFFGSIAGMDMGTYCRVNGIQGQGFRPDFREHSCIGSPNSLRDYLTGKGFRRIVAVEDYVGTGSQMKTACKYLSQLTGYQILLSPILIAADGVNEGRKLAIKHSHLSFEPVFPIPVEATVPENPPTGVLEPSFLKKLRAALQRLWKELQSQDPNLEKKNAFGFRGTGSLVLTYLNCPNNVPPLIHQKSDTWEPLFRRASREG